MTTADPTMRAHRLFARFSSEAALRAGEPAVTSEGSVLSFASLHASANRLAAELAARGVSTGTVVALHLPRGLTQVVALMGILRIGACYVPLDPTQPDVRLGFMVTQSLPQLVISLSSLRCAALADIRRLDLDLFPGLLASSDPTDSIDPPDALAPALLPLYTIFTSGSTGRPKGVRVAGGSVEWLLDALESADVVRSGVARVAWNASIGFDASVQQWARICRGDHLFTIGEETRRDPAALVDFLHRHRIDDLDLTPSHAQALLEELERRPLPGLRLLVGGEAIGPTLWERLGALTRLGMDAVNLYGPTETTVDATQAQISSGQPPTLGRALPGVVTRVLDCSRREVIPGAVGELAIGGPGVALGYIGRAGLSATRFVPHDVGEPGLRLYLTGDQVRQNQDGSIEYLGRADGQVKVRGHRVEVGEVEEVLLAHAGVRAVAVVARPDGSALSVAVVLADPATLATLAAHAAAHLPDWMRPADWFACNELPLNPSGKLDLQQVRLLFTTSGTLAPPYVAPSDVGQGDAPIAERITRVWMDVLRRPLVMPEDDFFALGGNSLAAMQVGSRLHALYQRRVPTRHLFEHPTLAAYIDAVSPTLLRSDRA